MGLLIHEGFTINSTRLQKNYTDFLKAIDDVKALLPAGTNIDNGSVLELVTLFADTWFSLDAYDKDNLATQGDSKKKVVLTAEKLQGHWQSSNKILSPRGRPLIFLARLF